MITARDITRCVALAGMLLAAGTAPGAQTREQ